ncbi:hypothetical protein DB31_7184 [Hyalangium minutum]|uniref:Uncharacterized protein n=1 Tax=Hyalangium minutum TaxID=394096 RepID=A0A085WJT4_9BACT|nr:hypothetical protein DB31_7184 [Hyalangium minutum]
MGTSANVGTPGSDEEGHVRPRLRRPCLPGLGRAGRSGSCTT